LGCAGVDFDVDGTMVQPVQNAKTIVSMSAETARVGLTPQSDSTEAFLPALIRPKDAADASARPSHTPVARAVTPGPLMWGAAHFGDR
jgi:hypothetical protein